MSFARFLAIALPTLLVVLLASRWTAYGLDSGFYDGLEKPAWTPPAPVFGIAWSILYPLMVMVQYRAEGATIADAARELRGLYWAQLVINGLWCWLFFRLERLTAASLELAALNMCVADWKGAVNRAAPQAGTGKWISLYQIWIAFALVLSIWIALLNS